MMLQKVFLPLFFPGWPLSNVAAIYYGEYSGRLMRRIVEQRIPAGRSQGPTPTHRP